MARNLLSVVIKEVKVSQLLARDLMSAPVQTVGPVSPVSEVVRLMEEDYIRHIPVVDETQRLLGIISHRDVLRCQSGSLSREPSAQQLQLNRRIEARSLMTREVRTASPETPALEVALTLRSGRYGCVPIIDAGCLAGIVTEADFVEYAIQTLSDPGV